jgi:hypothetical protein
MKTPAEIKAFVNHCKDIAVELDDKSHQFERVCIQLNGEVYCVLEDSNEDTYTLDLTDYLNAPMADLRAKREERERLIRDEISKHEVRQTRFRLALERSEYERLKAKFENEQEDTLSRKVDK